MYHSGTSPSIQEHVLQSLRDPNGKVRVTIATNALGMGVDIKGLYNVIHYGPRIDLEFYMQGMGRAGKQTTSKRLEPLNGKALSMFSHGRSQMVNIPRHFYFFTVAHNFVSVNQRCKTVFSSQM